MSDLGDLSGRSNRPVLAAIRSSRALQRPAQRRARPLQRAERGPVGPRTQRNLDLLATMQQARQRRSAAVPAPAPQEPEREGGLGGNLGGLMRLAKGIPQGVLGLGMQAGDTVLGVPRLLADLARQRVPQQVEGEGGWQEQLLAGVDEYFPLLHELSESGTRTVQRVANPTEYLRAWDEGRLAEALVEDVGNVALAGGLASRVLGATSKPVTLTAREAAAVTGGTRPRAAGAMTAEDIAITPLVRHAGAPDPAALTRVTPHPATRTVTLPGRGVAGAVERAGNRPLAERIGRVGAATRTVSRLGERGANLPAYPYVGAARVGGRAVEAVTGRRPGALLRAGVERAGARGGALFPYTDDGRRYSELNANIQRSHVDAQRFAIVPARIAEEAGLAPELGRAALFSVDQMVQPIVAMVRQFGEQVGDEAIDEIIRRSYEGQGPGGTTLEPGVRPTPADVRAVIAFEDRALPANTLAGMDAVAAAQRTIAEQRTEVQVSDMPEGEGLNPEQLGTEQRSFVLDRERRKIEQVRDRTQSKLERETPRAARLSRIADATEAVNALLPEPPRANRAFRQGQRSGRAAAADSLARRAHTAAQTELRQALDAYMRAEGDGEALQRAAAQVDRLTDRAVQLEGDVQAARTRLSDVYGEQRAARRTLGFAQRQADRGLTAADRAVTGAGERVEATAPVEGPSLGELRPETDTTWRRFAGRTGAGEPTAPRSRGERAMIDEGRTRARADAAQARVARMRRSLDTRNERIADLPNELSRRFQERLATDINQPAVVRVRNVIRKGGTVLGDIIDDKRTGPYLTGNLRRLAVKYRVYNDVLGELDQMRQGGRARGPLAEVADDGSVPMSEVSATDRGAVLLDALGRRGITLDSVDAQSLADSVGADQLLDDIAVATREDRVAGLQANSPYRMRDLVEQSPWPMPDDVRSQFRNVFEQYERQRARHLSTVFDRYAEAAPARYRRLMQTGRRQVRALLDVAEERNRVDAGSGDIYIRMAEATSSTLNELVDQGLDPTHLIGGDEIAAAFTAGSGRRLSQRATRAQHVARTGLRPLDPDAVSRVEADQMAKIIHNRTSRYVVESFGQRADQVPQVAEAMREYEAANAEPMPPKVLASVAKEAGWVPTEGSAVNPQTVLVSEAIDRQLQASRLDSSKMWSALRTGNRKWKSWVLPLSPKWMMGNIVGNVIQAQVHAGVNPVTLARRMREIVKQEGGLSALWDRSGLPDWAPAELASHGLSYNEWRIMYQQAGVEARTPIGRTIARSYKLNEFVDNLSRSATMLEQLKQGVPSDAAMNVALKSLGDFTRMSSFERKVVREILPFYAWMRHQTLATLRLPIHSPARAAWLLHLADLYTDPDMRDSLIEFIGNSIPLGGDSFIDAGSISPFATLPEVPFAPTTIGRSVSPLLKVPLAAATGIDLNRGGQQITRPAGTMRRGPYGQEEPTPPLYRLLTDPAQGIGEIGYIASQQAPSPIRSLRDLTLGPNARYGTGYEVTSGGRPLPDERRNRLSILLRGLNLPAPRTIDLEEMERRAAQQERRQRG